MTPTFAKLRPARTLCAATLVLLMLSGCSQAGSPRDRTPPAATADSREHLAKQLPRQAEVTGRASSYGDYLAGLFANKQRDLSAAADYMARALEEDPKNPALLHQTFVLMVSEGRMDEARALAGRLVALRPKHGPATVLLALENMRDGNPARADQLLARLSERGLAALVRPLLGSWIELALGDRTAALERLDELRAVDGFDMLHSLHVGLLNDVGGAADVAAEAYAQSLSRVDSPSLRLTWLIGNFHERQGERDEAAALYRRFLADDPGSTVMQDVLRAMEMRGSTPPEPMVRTPRDGLAEALFNLSGLLEQQNAGNLGLVYARYALHVRPDYAVARMLVGEILQNQNRHRDAIAVYRKVDASSPFHYVARLRVAEALEALERDREAMDLLEELAGQHPARYEPLYRLGNLLRTRERFAEADAAYGRALKRVETPEQRHWTLYYFRGIALERTEKWTEAEEHLLKALELQPEQPYVMNYLAYSWVEQEAHLEKALDMLKRAVELRPEDGYIVDSLGWAHYRLDHYQDAVGYLERAVELRPADPVINDHLGDAYWRVGRREEARFQWHRALSLEPEADAVSTIEVKLERGLDAADGPNG